MNTSLKSSDAERRNVAVVTGGGTGIGLACARHFAAMGWRVIALGMDREDADAPGVEFSKLDITDEVAVQQAVQGLDGIDALVNAAGLIRHEGREWGSEGFRQVLEVNLVGTQLVTMACKDGLAKRQGAVVNFASMFSWFGSRNNPSYAASKGAVVALTRSHAMAFADLGIRVNAVAPGWIDTRLASGAIHNPDRAPGILARIPAKRWGTADEVAEVVGFLSTAPSRYVTGALVPVDGGFHIG